MATPDAAVTIEPRVLAVDGGQSGIRVRHSADSHTIEAPGTSRTADTDARVADAVVDAWQALGRPAVDRVVLGMTTAPVDPERAPALARSVGEAISAPEAWACDDSVTSHAGALSLGWGVSLAAGTGVACLAVPATGEPRIIGGHGYLLGDEGGGFWIGRRGLPAALRASEGRAEPTTLRSVPRADSGPRRSARPPARRRPTGRRHRPVRLGRARRPPPTMTSPPGSSGRPPPSSTTSSARARCRRSRSASEPVPVGLGGRLLTTPTALRRALDALLAADPALRPRTADHSPLEGAMPSAVSRSRPVRRPGPHLAEGPVVTDTIATAAGRLYLIEGTLRRLGDDEWPNLSAAAEIVADAIAGGGDIHAFGTGHSHMLAEEVFYRAGGLVRVRPILFEGLMLHADATAQHLAGAPAGHRGCPARPVPDRRR